MNKIWKKNNFLFIGEHDMSWFAYNTEVKKFFELDVPSGSEVRRFISFDELLDVFFDRALG